MWDVVHPYEHPESPSEVYITDTVYFVGIDFEIPL
jgi:hypothetical protein